MAKWRQGDTYEDVAAEAPPKKAEVKEPPIQVVEDEDGNKKRKVAPSFRTIALALGVIAVIVVGIVLMIRLKMHNEPIMNDPNTPATGDIINPNSSENLDDFLNPGGVTLFSYTAEEKEELRAWGYTGTEIEQFQSDSIPAADKVAEAKKLREDTWAALNNSESPEYRALLDQTWIGEAETAVPSVDATVWSVEGKKINADYEKVPPRGKNLFIKVDMRDGTHYFMQCPCDLYVSLEDSGNINLSYTLYTMSDGSQFIYNMKYIEVG